MKRTGPRKKIAAENPLRTRNTDSADAFRRRDPASVLKVQEPYVHFYKGLNGKGVICETETRGYVTPDNKSLTEIVVDASGGFIPLWVRGTTLQWRFQEESMAIFQDASAAKQAIRNLLGEAILAWGDAAPIRFSESNKTWDFEIKMRAQEACDPRGCVLASAFFPDSGRHELEIYPTMLNQDRADQVNTLTHEIGHVFGLRHFFAQISETRARAEIFGTHNPESIMNYGVQSHLTDQDKSDLKRIYQLVWSGQLTAINGTPIKLVKPFTAVNAGNDLVAVADRLAAAATIARMQCAPQAELYASQSILDTGFRYP